MPDTTNRLASLPVNEAMKDSREVVVGSSRKTSSSSVVWAIAVSIVGVGVVTTSERKSKAAWPGEDQLLLLLRLRFAEVAIVRECDLVGGLDCGEVAEGLRYVLEP